MYYVIMTDTFLSGWGMSEGKKNKLVFECGTLEEAKIVENNGKNRPEMEGITITQRKPTEHDNEYMQVKTKDDYPSWYKEGYFYEDRQDILETEAKEIVEILKEEVKEGYIETKDDLMTAIQENVNDKIIDYDNCWKIAKEAGNLTNYDSGLWEGAESADEMVQGIAYAVIQQEIYDLIQAEYPELRKILN